jgi:hypothetical protein
MEPHSAERTPGHPGRLAGVFPFQLMAWPRIATGGGPVLKEGRTLYEKRRLG